MKRFRGATIVLAVIGALVLTEYISHKRVNPTGKFTNLREYLAYRPSSDWFETLDGDGKHYVIAYGPMASWLMLSSGSSAYVFDNTGRLVDWSSDVGDDGNFHARWDSKGLGDQGRSIPRKEVERIASTQPGAR